MSSLLCCDCLQCQEQVCKGLKMALVSEQNGSRMSENCLLPLSPLHAMLLVPCSGLVAAGGEADGRPL